MFLAALLSTGLVAEPLFAQVTPRAPQETAPPVVPAGHVPTPATLKPEPKSETSKADLKKKKSTAEKTSMANAKQAKNKTAAAEGEKTPTPISPGPAVAKEKNVNVRGQAAINSEIVTRLKQGDLVTVLEAVTLKKPKTDEPATWAKVALPAGSAVWVSAHFIDPTTRAVVPKKLNLRSGPGENYSILGRIEKGTALKEIETQGDWLKIEAPTNAYAFIAAHLLSTDPADLSPALAKAKPPAPPAAPPPPIETALVSPPPPPPPAEPLPTTSPVAPPPLAATSPPVVTPPPPPPATLDVTAPEPPVEEPPPKRIVTREGIVKGSASIQAPTYFVLRSLDNNKTIDYLFCPSTNITMKEYQLQRVIVTGEELLDERWPNTPVINVETIQPVP